MNEQRLCETKLEEGNIKLFNPYGTTDCCEVDIPPHNPWRIFNGVTFDKNLLTIIAIEKNAVTEGAVTYSSFNIVMTVDQQQIIVPVADTIEKSEEEAVLDVRREYAKLLKLCDIAPLKVIEIDEEEDE